MRTTHTHTYSVLEIKNDSFEDIAQRLYDGAGPTYFTDGKISQGVTRPRCELPAGHEGPHGFDHRYTTSSERSLNDSKEST